MKRPQVTEDMIQQAADVVAPKLEADAESIVQAYSHPMDGYELAKALERECLWDVSRDDMEMLDEVESIVSSLYRNAEKEWFDSNDIQPPLPVGTEIKQGVIKGIYEYMPAYYKVKEHGCDDPSRHLLIKYEDAESV